MDIEISVIIPTRNNEKTIERAISSILSQSFSLPYEIVVILDNCTDKTPEVVADLASVHPIIRYFKASCGSANIARFEGVAKAKGKYITFLDGDDYYHRSALEKWYTKITETNADMVNANLYYVRRFGPRKAKLRAKATYDKRKAMAALFRDLSFKGFLYTKIFRADLLRRLRIALPKRNNLYEDNLLILCYLLLCKKVINIPDCLVYYDKSNVHSLSATASDRLLDNIKVRAKVREVLEEYHETEGIEEFRKWSLRPKTLLFADSFLTKFPSKEERKRIRKLSKEEGKLIFGESPLPKKGRSYSPYLEEVKIKVLPQEEKQGEKQEATGQEGKTA